MWGSEEEFVNHMNERAAGLGMEHTHFVNCCGLDTEGHLTTARDIALMSQEMVTKYPQIENYSMIWMENITHTTNKGSSEFGLANTNKSVSYTHLDVYKRQRYGCVYPCDYRPYSFRYIYGIGWNYAVQQRTRVCASPSVKESLPPWKLSLIHI